ncbi:response regulator [Candidatus Margulisiibacteriota bacterium]
MGKKKILIIDDEKSLALLIKANLDYTGKYSVELAYSGEEGVKKAEENDYALILTDFKMPGMNGEEVLNTIKSKKPQAPIVLVSVYHDDETTVTPKIRNKADGLISKPFDSKQLVETIENVIAKTKKTCN